MPSNFQENTLQTEDANNFQEDMPQGIWEKATEVSSLFRSVPFNLGKSIAIIFYMSLLISLLQLK